MTKIEARPDQNEDSAVIAAASVEKRKHASSLGRDWHFAQQNSEYC
jgi:hypothetical protein